MYITTSVYAATNNAINIQFYVNEEWTTAQLFASSATLGSIQTNTYTLGSQPTKLRFVATSTDNIDFWKITLNEITVHQWADGLNSDPGGTTSFQLGTNTNSQIEIVIPTTTYTKQDNPLVPLYIGRDHDNDHMYGELFDFRYYKRALSPEEVKSTYSDHKLLGDEVYRAVYDTENSMSPQTSVARDELLKEPWLLVTHLKNSVHGTAYNDPWNGTSETGSAEVLYPLKDFLKSMVVTWKFIYM